MYKLLLTYFNYYSLETKNVNVPLLHLFSCLRPDELLGLGHVEVAAPVMLPVVEQQCGGHCSHYSYGDPGRHDTVGPIKRNSLVKMSPVRSY